MNDFNPIMEKPKAPIQNSILSQIDWVNYLVQALLIIFSVLLALFLNEFFSNKKEQKKADASIVRVLTELNDNLEVLNIWSEKHNIIQQNLESIISDPLTKQHFLVDHNINFALFAPDGLANEVISTTSWEMIRSSGLLEMVDYDLSYALSNLYDIQKLGVTESFYDLLSFVSGSSSRNPDNVDITIAMLESKLRNLVGQEYFLINLYEETLSISKKAGY